MRSATILFKNEPAGILTQNDDGSFILHYHDEWLANSNKPSLSLTPVSYTHLDVYKRQVYIESGKKYLASKGHDGFYERYLVAKDFLVISKKLKLLEVKKNTQSIGLAILDWKWSIKNEFSNFADFKIDILNPTNKIVKYLCFNISAYDAVDGLLFNSGKSIVSLKGIGPIGSNEISSYAFDKVFYSPVIHKMKIRSIKIQYMDGSIKIITDVSKIIIKV